jgi:hypothetical protein
MEKKPSPSEFIDDKNYEHYRSDIENLNSVFKKLSRKNKNWGLIKLKEYYYSLIYELEIIESEDCTQEMNDMAGYVNMMETGNGTLTCVNTHLAKEKSKMFNEIKNYVKEHNQNNYLAPPPMDLGASMINNSMITGDMLQRKSTMMNMQRSQILNRKSTMIPNYSSPQGFNKNGRIEQSQVMNSPNSPEQVNNSMYMNSMNNFGSLVNSQVFPSNPNNMMNPLTYKPKQSTYKRRQTVRQSVLQTFQKFKTMNQGLNESLISRKNKNDLSEVDIYSVYTKSKISNHRVNT